MNYINAWTNNFFANHDGLKSIWSRCTAYELHCGRRWTLFDLERGPVLSQTSFAIDAAIATRGVALARSALVELDLREGRLIRPVTEQINASFSYWIVCPKASALSTNIQRFKEWLIAVRE